MLCTSEAGWSAMFDACLTNNDKLLSSLDLRCCTLFPFQQFAQQINICVWAQPMICSGQINSNELTRHQRVTAELSSWVTVYFLCSAPHHHHHHVIVASPPSHKCDIFSVILQPQTSQHITKKNTHTAKTNKKRKQTTRMNDERFGG